MECPNVDQKYVPPENMPDYDRTANIPKKALVGQTSGEKFFDEDKLDRTVAISSYFSGNLDELDERVMTMIEKK